MRIRPAIRKSVKWGGAALAVVLLVAWIGSAWWAIASPSFRLQRAWVGGGGLGLITYSGNWPFDIASFELGPSELPFCWWFDHIRKPQISVRLIPLWAPLLLTLIPTGFAWRADLIARRRAMLGKCTQCGYSRAGLTSDAVCPECGAAAGAAS